MKRFKLGKAFKCQGVEVVFNKSFKDGVLEVSDEDGAKMASALVNFYGCTMEDVKEPEVQAPQGGSKEADLSKQTTKA